VHNFNLTTNQKRITFATDMEKEKDNSIKKRIQRRVTITSDHLEHLTAYAAKNPAYRVYIEVLNDGKQDQHGMVTITISQYNIGSNQAFSNLIHFFLGYAESKTILTNINHG